MNVVFQLQGVEFEWHDEKAKLNEQQHKIKFEEAAEAFFDPFYQSGDASVDENEKRDFIIGYSFSQKLLLVVFIERAERTRIISARPVTRQERKEYEES